LVFFPLVKNVASFLCCFSSSLNPLGQTSYMISQLYFFSTGYFSYLETLAFRSLLTYTNDKLKTLCFPNNILLIGYEIDQVISTKLNIFNENSVSMK
jgi:hypothetical protein